MKYPEIKNLFFSTLFACIPVQAATTLFDDFSAGVSSNKYRAMEEKAELNTFTENLELAAGMQGYLENTRANNLSLRQRQFIGKQCNPSVCIDFCGRMERHTHLIIQSHRPV